MSDIYNRKRISIIGASIEITTKAHREWNKRLSKESFIIVNELS
jgi:hypothetical protein